MTGRAQPSWTSPLLQSATFCVRLREPSSLGIHPWYAPLYRLSRVRPLPGSELPFGDERATVRRSVPSSWFCTTSTVFPALGLAGLLHPATGSGVRCVSAAPRPRGCRSDRVAVDGLPRNAFHTLRRIPPVSSRTASLRPLPSCCYLPIHTAFHTEVLVAAGRGTLLNKNVLRRYRGISACRPCGASSWRTRPVSRVEPSSEEVGSREARSKLRVRRGIPFRQVMLRSAEADPHVTMCAKTEVRAPASLARDRRPRTSPKWGSSFRGFLAEAKSLCGRFAEHPPKSVPLNRRRRKTPDWTTIRRNAPPSARNRYRVLPTCFPCCQGAGAVAR